MPLPQVSVNKRTMEFYEVEKLYFPNVCLICGKMSLDKLHRKITGSIPYNKEQRKDYYLEIPVCMECNEKISISKGKEIFKLIAISLTGLIGVSILFYFTFSIFLPIAILTGLLIISFVYYNSKISKKLNLKNFIQITSYSLSESCAEDVLQLTIHNDAYAQNFIELNLEQNKNLKTVKKINPLQFR
jgi:hypothetical protein